MIKYKKISKGKWSWKLTESYSYGSNQFFIPGPPAGHDYIAIGDLGVVTLKEGYAINGANCFPDFKCIMRGVFLHDGGWQLVEENILQKNMVKVFDKILRDVVIEDTPKLFGLNKALGWTLYLGARIGAKWRFGIRW